MNGTTELLSCLVKHDEGGGSYSFMMSGEPHARGLVEASAASWNRVTGRTKPGHVDLEARLDAKVTIVQQRPLAFGGSSLYAIEGRIALGRSGGLMIVPKGQRSKGFLLGGDKGEVLDLFDGYGGTEAAVELMSQVQTSLPELKPLTQERLEQLPREDTDEVTLAVYGTHAMFNAPECVWLFTSYWDVDDILDREILLIPPAYGVSEHGSMYGRDLLRFNVGEVVGFEPMTWRDAYGLIELAALMDHHQAVRYALADKEGRESPAAA